MKHFTLLATTLLIPAATLASMDHHGHGESHTEHHDGDMMHIQAEPMDTIKPMPNMNMTPAIRYPMIPVLEQPRQRNIIPPMQMNMPLEMHTMDSMEEHGHDMHGGMHHMMQMEIPIDATPSTKEYMRANMDMHTGMMIDYTGKVDIDFLRGMIPHHQGAVDMCKTELKYGRNGNIRALCNNIIRSQEFEIRRMNMILRTLEAEQSADAKMHFDDHDHRHSNLWTETNNKMHEEMNIDYSGNADIDFVKGMIPHHQGAIDMCKIAIEHGENANVQSLCNEIMAAQNSEIRFMKKWLNNIKRRTQNTPYKLLR